MKLADHLTRLTKVLDMGGLPECGIDFYLGRGRYVRREVMRELLHVYLATTTMALAKISMGSRHCCITACINSFVLRIKFLSTFNLGLDLGASQPYIFSL